MLVMIIPTESREAAQQADGSQFPPPTRARYIVLGFLCTLAFVLYLDRVCISQALVPIQADLHLSETQTSLVLMAFTLAYGLFEVPTGHWGDRLGARRILTRISIWWSVFTALTAACTGFYSMVLVRFLFGAGEAGAFPNAARVISRWIPPTQRGRAQGLFQMAALVGGAGSPVCAAYLIRAIGWRWTFVVFGVTGVLWAVAFFWWFRDEPAEHSRVNAAELQLIGTKPPSTTHPSIPWATVATSPGIWLLAIIMMCASFNSYVYFSWFSKYLQAAREVSPERASWLSSLVLAFAAVGTISGGAVTDLFRRLSQHPLRLRRLWGFGAYLLSAVLLTAGMICESPLATAVFAACSTAATHLTNPSWWSCATEIAGRHVGAMFGLMNGLGVVGAMSSQLLFGVLADVRKEAGYTGRYQWDPAFYIVAAVLLTAACCWLFVDTSRAVDEEARPTKGGC